MNGDRDPAREFLASIDRTIHEPARLIIMSHLYVLESADFQFLLAGTGLSEGNLSSHLRKLEEAEYIAVEKGYKGRRPHTMMSLTRKGRASYRRYHSIMREFFSEKI